jgi:hypothetical protein
MVGGKPEVIETPLEDGFVSLFNGKDLTGWWENCASHTTDTRVGGVWIVDPNSGILYSREEGPNGNFIVTNANYEHYEFIMDLWTVYGNDGGIFNRVTRTGSNWQTTLDYIQGSGVAGSYNEKSWSNVNINEDPFKFGPAGPGAPEVTSWTTFTRNQNPTSFGCSTGGCVSSDFPKIWNLESWNQIRVKFYGGLVAGDSVRMETFIRKVATPEIPWVPVYKAARMIVTPAGPIGLQIHGGGRWKAGTYNLYRNMKLRRLNKDGTPITSTQLRHGKAPEIKAPDVGIENGYLTASLSADHSITLRDIRGNFIESISAPAGLLRHALPANLRGIFFAELKSVRGSHRVRLMRI